MHLKSVGGGVINGLCWFTKCVLWQNAPKQDNSETALDFWRKLNKGNFYKHR